MELKPILETGEQIYNWLKEHFEYEPQIRGPREVLASLSPPQIIILPSNEGQLLLSFMSDNGEMEALEKLFGCDVYISSYAEQIEIF